MPRSDLAEIAALRTRRTRRVSRRQIGKPLGSQPQLGKNRFGLASRLRERSRFTPLIEVHSGDEDTAPGPMPPSHDPHEAHRQLRDREITWECIRQLDAEEYRVYVSRNGNDPQLIGTTEKTELTSALPPGNYQWAVEAVPDDCPSIFSPRVGFTIAEGQNCSDAGTTLVSPANNSTDVTPPADFVWTPVSGAVK